MKITYTYFILNCLFLTPIINGYCKYSFIWYDFGIVKKKPNDQIFCVAKGDCPFKHRADYGFLDQAKGVKIYRTVRLNLADLRHVRKGLEVFTPETKITDALIAQFSGTKQRMKKQVVSWVLRDFQKVKDQATVGDVRRMLRL